MKNLILTIFVFLILYFTNLSAAFSNILLNDSLKDNWMYHNMDYESLGSAFYVGEISSYGIEFNQKDDKEFYINKLNNVGDDSCKIETFPECINLTDVLYSIKYPFHAVEMGLEGNVKIQLLVDLYGSIDKITGITGTEMFFDEVKKACMNLIFKPAICNGKLVQCSVKINFNFKILQGLLVIGN